MDDNPFSYRKLQTWRWFAGTKAPKGDDDE